MTPTNPKAAAFIAWFRRQLSGEPHRQVTTPAELVLMREARVQEQIRKHRRHRSPQKTKCEKRYNATVEEPTMFQPRGRQGELFGGD